MVTGSNLDVRIIQNMWSDKVAAKNRNDGSDSKVLDERNEARYYALVGMKNLCQPDYGQKDNENSLKDLLDWAERDLKNIPERKVNRC